MIPNLNSSLPVPPAELAEYVGDRDRDNPIESYLWAGSLIHQDILNLVGGIEALDGKRVLDFGCGSGRTLRHFISDQASIELHGCDIDQACVEWLNENLCPPLAVVLNDEKPPLPYSDESFDLIWSTSVFTHLTDTWASWLLELHRVLKADGVALITFIGKGLYEQIAHEPYDPERVGMNVLGYGAPWHAGGPMVFHSPWWLHAHWGRLFEVEYLQESGFPGQGQPVGEEVAEGQGIVKLRKRDVALTVAELEALEPNEPRELLALQHSLRQTQLERAELNTAHDAYAEAYAAESKRSEELLGRIAELEATK